MEGMTSTPIVIVGAGGFGREVVDVVDAVNAERQQYELKGFLDDGEPDSARLARIEVPHLGGMDAAAELPEGTRYVIAIANATARESIAERLDAMGLAPATLVHPSVTIGRDVEIGEGSVVCAGTRITTNIRIGRHVILNLNVTVGHDAVIEDFVTVNPLVAISGETALRRGATMGTGSSINQGLTVGEGTVVGAGASVVKDLDAGLVAVGIPARPLQR